LCRQRKSGILDGRQKTIKTPSKVQKPKAGNAQRANEGGMSFIPKSWQEIEPKAQALIRAAVDGKIILLEEALAHDPALAHERDHKGYTALEVATRAGQIGSIRVLIQYGEPEDPRKHGNLLWLATQDHQLEALKELLPRVDIQAIRKSSQNPLSMAAWRGWMPGLEAMAPFFDLDEPDGSEEKTPLINAAASGCLDAVRFLLPLCDANTQGQGGQTALFFAAAYGHHECVSLLLTRCNPRIEDDNGRTAVNAALEDKSNAKCFDLLFEHANEEEFARGLDFYGLENLPRAKARQEAAELREAVKSLPTASPEGLADASCSRDGDEPPAPQRPAAGRRPRSL